MNYSVHTADRTTHLKIVATALVVAIVVVWVGVAARATDNASDRTPSKAYRPVVAPVTMIAAASSAATIR